MHLSKSTLLVEDYHWHLSAFAIYFKRDVLMQSPVVRTHEGDYAREFRDIGVDLATNFEEAERLVRSGRLYEIVFLDNHMPRDETKEGEEEHIGYRLMGLIRDLHPDVHIVGTSSAPEDKLADFDKPDSTIVKTGEDLGQQLAKFYKT